MVEYGLPDFINARGILDRRLGRFKLAPKSWAMIEPVLEGLSQAELVQAADAVIKDAILDGTIKLSLDALRLALQDRQALRSKFHRQEGR